MDACVYGFVQQLAQTGITENAMYEAVVERFGPPQRPLTQIEVAARHGVSRAAIQKVEGRALRKLRQGLGYDFDWKDEKDERDHQA